MPHARTQLRDAVTTVLTGLDATSGRVYVGRTRPLPEAHEPTLLIYAREERAAEDGQGRPVELLRSLTLTVEGRVSFAPVDDDADASRETEELLDQIALEVEAAIGADPTLGGKAFDAQLTATRINAQAPGARHQGEIALDFIVLYRTAENAPGVLV